MEFEIIYNSNKQEKLFGRYITNNHIKPLLDDLNADSNLKTSGFSVNNNSIYSYEIGSGTIKILIWSQMHGNEGTTTKAVMDFLKFLNSDSVLTKQCLQTFSLIIIPILNPDGAIAYTRENANNIDLNRDFVNRSQPETNCLLDVYNKFKPDFCFNMHDQRTIFGIKSALKPATVSFLAPSLNENRNFNDNRTKAAKLIAAMNNDLQKFIPNQVGRFDDGFNINCAGDYFQSQGIATILFEAGHFQNDYNREQTRKYIFYALLSAMNSLQNDSFKNYDIDEYLNIPQNFNGFFDIIYKNVKTLDNNEEKIINFAIQYSEVLTDNTIEFVAKIVKIDDLENSEAHLIIDAQGKLFSNKSNKFPMINDLANFKLNNIDIINGKMVII